MISITIEAVAERRRTGDDRDDDRPHMIIKCAVVYRDEVEDACEEEQHSQCAFSFLDYALRLPIAICNTAHVRKSLSTLLRTMLGLSVLKKWLGH